MAFTKIAAAGIGTTETVTVDGLTVINNGSFGGNLSVGGTLTYEDVTNVDSVGLITARNGIVVGSGITLSKDGNIFATGVTTSGNITISNQAPALIFTDTDNDSDFNIQANGGLLSFNDSTNSLTRLQIDSSGNLNIGSNASANPFTYLRFGASLYGAADIRPTNEASHKVGLAFYTDGTQDTTINPTEKVRITSGGAVGINETSPSAMLHVENDNANASTYYLNTDAAILVQNKNSNSSAKTVLKLEGPVGGGDCAFVYGSGSSNLLVADRDNERLRITDDGNMGFGTNGDPIDFVELKNSTAQKKLVLSKSNSGTADQNGMWLQFNNYGPAATGRADGTIIGKIHFYASQPTSGNLQDAGAIECRADGNQTGNNTRSRLSFLTVDSQTATERMRIDKDGKIGIGTVTPAALTHIYDATDTTSATEQFRISGGNRTADLYETGFRFLTQSPSANGNRYVSFTSNGNTGLIIQTHETSSGNAAGDRDILLNPENGDVGVGLGDGVNPSYRFHVKAGDVDQTARFDNSKTSDNLINYIGVSLGNAATTGTALFGITGHSTAGSQACWIGMAGDDVAGGYGCKVYRGGNLVNMQRIAVGTQDPANYVSGTDASLVIAYSKTYRFGLHIRPTDNDTGGGSPAIFQNNAGTTIGSITANASNIAYNTSSDYRLKENDISIIDGITRLKKLRPIKFNWKTDTEKTVDGFLAHEVSSSVPEAVIGEKDAVNEDGSIKPQQLDYSKLVPLLTAALQEEIAKRESLEARLDAAGL